MASPAVCPGRQGLGLPWRAGYIASGGRCAVDGRGRSWRVLVSKQTSLGSWQLDRRSSGGLGQTLLAVAVAVAVKEGVELECGAPYPRLPRGPCTAGPADADVHARSSPPSHGENRVRMHVLVRILLCGFGCIVQ